MESLKLKMKKLLLTLTVAAVFQNVSAQEITLDKKYIQDITVEKGLQESLL